MKTIYLTLMIGLLLIGIVIAGDTINNFIKERQIEKVQRDYLLSKVPLTFDIRGNPLPKEIKPVIAIECSKDICKWSAVQEGLISSYDNVFSKGSMTTNEIEDYVSDLVVQKLNDYANSGIEGNANPYIKISEGAITITEK